MRLESLSSERPGPFSLLGTSDVIGLVVLDVLDKSFLVMVFSGGGWLYWVLCSWRPISPFIIYLDNALNVGEGLLNPWMTVGMFCHIE